VSTLQRIQRFFLKSKGTGFTSADCTYHFHNMLTNKKINEQKITENNSDEMAQSIDSHIIFLNNIVLTYHTIAFHTWLHIMIINDQIPIEIIWRNNGSTDKFFNFIFLILQNIFLRNFNLWKIHCFSHLFLYGRMKRVLIYKNRR
jgi:hypothetical protein